MKLLASLLFVLAGLNGFSQKQPATKIPELNQKIIDYVNQNIGKKVGRGECWDLVQIPLTENNAKWDGKYDFGQKIDYKKDLVFPGDIIQFENVVIDYEDEVKMYTINLDHHTAVVYEVIAPGIYKVAEQNTNMHGRKVAIDDLDLKFVTKGTIQFYRPQK
ncbi:MAG: hypothetical protein ACO1O6_15505 [Bacteroidota bacterium]